MESPYVETLEPVWQDLDHVRVNEVKLQQLIDKMRQEDLFTPAWNVPNVHPAVTSKSDLRIDFVCWVGALNFAFTNFFPPKMKFSVKDCQGKEQKGAFALKAAFLRAYEEGRILSPRGLIDVEYINQISLEEVRTFFRPIDRLHSIPLLIQRWQILRDVAAVLLSRYNGSWMQLFQEADWRSFNAGKGIVEQLVSNFPSFRDERFYKGYHLLFQKRAQLLAMMYHGMALGSAGTMPVIKDIKKIGPICDYEVPRALRFLGVLEYTLEMADAIDSWTVIPEGHPFEIENRLAQAYVVAKICDKLGVTMDKVDFYVWSLGRKADQPHILVPTISY